MSDTRADTTSMGLYLISFIMLVFGLVGIYGYQAVDSTDAMVTFGALATGSAIIMMVAAFVFLFLGFSAWKAGNKLVMIIFLFLALFSALYAIFSGFDVPGAPAFSATAGYLVFVIMAVFLIVFALVALLGKAGFMLTILLVAAGLVFLFYGLFLNSDSFADGGNYLLLLGIFALVAFVISIYMAIADTTDVGLPVM